LTFPKFKRRVLDELNGDLALALAIDEKYDYANPFWQHAKYRWTSPTFRGDYGDAYDLAQRWICEEHDTSALDWRILLRIKCPWQGGIRSPDPMWGSSAILPFCRWLLLNGLRQDGVLDQYDRFVISRSDFVWLCPHPPLSVLDRDAIWVPNGEDHGGLNDRHLVASRADVENCLNVIEDVLLQPFELYDEIKDKFVDNEFLLMHHLDRKGLLHKVRRFPYIMYLARELNDESPTYSRGYYEPAVGHYVKYEKEFRNAYSYASIIGSRADWENKAWMQFDPTLAITLDSMPRRVWNTCQGTYYWIRSGLKRPGRVGRVARFLKRMLNVRPPAGDLS
jgi:hypothetical protein